MAKQTEGLKLGDPAREEPFSRLVGLASEIQFIKQQQWRIIYYNLLLFSAIIILYQQNIILPNRLYCILKYITILIIAAVTFLSHLLQNRFIQSLNDYRLRLDIIEKEILDPDLTKKIEESFAKKRNRQIKGNSMLPPIRRCFTNWTTQLPKPFITAKDKAKDSFLFNITFLLFSYVGAIAAVIVLIFDR